MNEWTPDIVVCGPGGSRGFLILGALKCLFEEKLQNNELFMSKVNKWVGISVGAAISLLIVAGYSIDEIVDLCIDVNLIDDILCINLEEAKQKMGLIKNKTVEEKLKQFILQKYSYIPTLEQLYMLTGLHLTLVAFNIDKMRPEFLDRDTEPELSCVEAAMMSMAVPILMQPRKHKGNIFIDGALGAPYPVLSFDHDNNNVLGMYISSEEDLYSSDKKASSFIYRLIQASMKVLRDVEIKHASSNVKHIPLRTMIRDTTGILIDKESRQLMINQGYECAENFLKINRNPEKYNISFPENEEIPF